MKESPTLVELDLEETRQLGRLIGTLSPIRFPRIHKLITYEGQDFLFLDGADCSHLPGEIVKLDYERGKAKDLLGKKFERRRSIGSRICTWFPSSRVSLSPRNEARFGVSRAGCHSRQCKNHGSYRRDRPLAFGKPNDFSQGNAPSR